LVTVIIILLRLRVATQTTHTVATITKLRAMNSKTTSHVSSHIK